jgi:small-conductance mechanosensitive channel
VKGLAIVLAAVLLVVALVAAAVAWRDELGAPATFAGLLAVAVAIALRDAFRAATCWFDVVAGGLYRVGDRVELAGVAGEVVAVTPLRTTLRDDVGRLVAISNGAALESPVARIGDGDNELRIGIPYRADWERAERILLEEPAVTSVRVALTDSWIELALRYEAPRGETARVRDELSRAILRGFADAGIPIASRTVEVVVGDPVDPARPAELP